ncbi:MAG TPA: hypothetical protein P5305_01450 [Rubrivivax sp.]|nr:hypothetical protein [Rubrivivax sp.]HRY86518.1 hypothetical protein [Rubrivivax sp.]
MTKFAFFIGGPLDGQRHIVQELRPSVEMLHAERAAVPVSYGGTERQVQTTRLRYVMPSRPINPRMHLACHVEHDVIDAEIGVYHYVGGERTR